MCHHPSRFSKDCVDFDMHEEKEIKESEKPVLNDLEEAANEFANQNCVTFISRKKGFKAGAEWGAEHLAGVRKMISDDLEGAKEEYLRKARSTPGHEWMTRDIEDAFKAGAEWQYQKDRGKFAKIKAKTWCEGFDACKEQMMKGAVEGYVNYYEDSGGILMAEAQVGCPYHNGDKVRIIIVKEGEE